MPDYFDDLETRSGDARQARQYGDLAAQIAHAKQNAPYFTDLLKDIDAAAITTPEALATLPVTRKSDLIELQKKTPPLGGLTATPLGNLARIYQSPGPIYDAEGTGADYWRAGRAFYAAGFRAGDIVHNTFSYHFTPAGAMIESGARAVGCAVFPAGVGQTELQIEAIVAIRPTAFAGTPSFLKILLEKGRDAGKDLSSISKAAVAGEALPPALRNDLKSLGVDVLQWYGTADVGLIGYESEAREGLIVDEGIIVEIVRPGTNDPVEPGEVGEVVVTTFNPDYPLLRFGTGDLSAVMDGISPCGRTNMRLKGWMGRADQSTKVKGMFVHPSQVAEVLKRHPEITRGRLVITQENGADVMTLHCEGENLGDSAAIEATVQAVCKLKGRVMTASIGELANDGKVIDDQRSYE